MSTVAHEPSERRQWVAQLRVREMWAAVAIAFMWLAVLFDALFGPDFVEHERHELHDHPVSGLRGSVRLARHAGGGEARLRPRRRRRLKARLDGSL